MSVLMYKGINLSGSGKAVATEFDEIDSDKKVASATLTNTLKSQVDKMSEDISDSSSTTVFSEDGKSITQTYDDGSKEVTTFNDDGSITLEIYDTKGVVKETKVTTFNKDGSIREEVTTS